MPQDREERAAAAGAQHACGEIVAHPDAPPHGRPIREGREAEFRHAEHLMATGAAHLRERPPRLEIARRCFHAATGLYAAALDAGHRLVHAWERLGYTCHLMGDLDEAESCYLRSLAIQQGTGRPFTLLSKVTAAHLNDLYRATGRTLLDGGTLGDGGVDTEPSLERVKPPRPPRGQSGHGLRFADVVAAFQQAERELGTNSRLSGRGHCRRVTLDARYSRVLRPAIRSCAWVSPHSAPSSRILFPLALAQRAAEILRVDPTLLIGQEY